MMAATQNMHIKANTKNTVHSTST